MKKQINQKRLDGYKLALVIRQLENSEVWHECLDVENEGAEDILAQYGIFYHFTEQELSILKEYLLELAAREEIREAMRWANQEHDPVLLAVPNRPAPSPETLERQHKAWKEKRAAKPGRRSMSNNIFKSIIHEVI